MSYDDLYDREECYWGREPSALCYRVLQLRPPDRSVKVLDIGCGEGRNALLFARYGYQVTAFDLSARGVAKVRKLADAAGVSIEVFQADLLEYRLTDHYDVIFSTGALHYIPENLRWEILGNYREFTSPCGLHVFSLLIEKPFIPRAPDADATARRWISGELFTYYHDWRLLHIQEEIFDCNTGGVPHEHAVNRMVAEKPC
jgi:tellurite methyltransferase